MWSSLQHPLTEKGKQGLRMFHFDYSTGALRNDEGFYAAFDRPRVSRFDFSEKFEYWPMSNSIVFVTKTSFVVLDCARDTSTRQRCSSSEYSNGAGT